MVINEENPKENISKFDNLSFNGWINLLLIYV